MTALRVRTKGPGNRILPKYLYQSMPASAISLMATLPMGDFPLSIPHQRYPIRESLPESIDGYVITYSLQPNRRYEAANVRFGGRVYGMAEFQSLAAKYVAEHTGEPVTVSGQYIYLIPDTDQWNVILRDNGYIAVDHFTGSAQIPVEEDHGPRLSSSLMIRIPVQRGRKQSSGAMLPVFARVELTLYPLPLQQSRWICFETYQRVRRRRARPPDSILPEFSEWEKRLSVDIGFESWVFREGMRFGSQVEWWGDGNRRSTEHEGIDFAEGKDAGGLVCGIPEGTPVRAISQGEAVAVLDDFLAKTVVLRHGKIENGYGAVFHTLYSHIQPEIAFPSLIAKGQILGTIRKLTPVSAPAHLHLGAAWIPLSLPSRRLKMQHINPAFAPVSLVKLKI
jgi:hypothetical protein